MKTMSKNVINTNEVNTNEAVNPNYVGEDIPTSAVAVVTPEIEKRDEIGSMLTVADFTNPQAHSMFTTIEGTDRKSKIAVYNAISAPEKKIAECIGEVISVKDFVIHEVTVLDEHTGELTNLLRAVLIDVNNVSYEAVSIGVANSLQRAIALVGKPSADEPITFKIKQKKTRNGDNKVTILEIVE